MPRIRNPDLRTELDAIHRIINQGRVSWDPRSYLNEAKSRIRRVEREADRRDGIRGVTMGFTVLLGYLAAVAGAVYAITHKDEVMELYRHLTGQTQASETLERDLDDAGLQAFMDLDFNLERPMEPNQGLDYRL